MKLGKKKIFFIVLGILLLVSIYLDTYLLLKYKVLPTKYLIVYGVVVGLIPILLILYTIFRNKKSKIKGVFGIIEMLYIIVLFLAFFYLNKTFNFLDSFTKRYNYETKNYYVVTLKDSDYSKLEDLNNHSIGYAGSIDESASLALEELNKKLKTNNIEVFGYGEMFEKLVSKELDSALIVQTYYDVLIENDETISKYYKTIGKIVIKEKVEEVVKDVDVTKDSFNIYISGIDSYGSVTDKDKSDVNIVMSVNPRAHKVLLINIPRDYYVDLVGYNAKDKLTHAGSYGVKVSVKTLEKLLDTEINYYVKVNYNALINLVDALGGVDVESVYDFVTYEFYYNIKKGINHLDGKLALDFVRTRKAFKAGDRVRGENQQRMIAAILKKVISPNILVKYGDLLKAIDGNFATNISTDNITSMINMQLDKMPKWSIESISLDGSDGKEITYSYQKQELYVMIPNEESIKEVKTKLEELKNA